MIPRHEVTDVLVDAATAHGAAQAPAIPVGDHGHPLGLTDTHTRYVILELVPGSTVESSQGVPEIGAWLRYRVRSVGRDPNRPVSPGAMARREAEYCADVFRAWLLDTTVDLSGVGWRVGARYAESSAGVDVEGTVANLIEDFALWVTTVPV